MTRWDVLRMETMQRANGVEEFRVRRMIAKGKLGPGDCIRRSGESQWIKISEIDDSVWTDPPPTDEEIEKRAEKKKHKSRHRDKKPKPIEPPRTITPLPMPPAPGVPDSDSETVAGEFVASAEGKVAADDAFELGPAEPLDVAPARRPRVAAPPMRRAKADDDDEPLRLGRPRKSEELDLTSMVDVTFLLILFFMVTATYTLQKSLEVPPPNPEDSTAQQAATLDDLRDDNIIVEVLADNSILINDRPAPRSELVDLIRREVRETGLNEVIIQASGEAHHETVVGVFDAANEVGVQRIRITSTAIESEPSG